MERKITGSRYDSALTTTEIAKKVREYVKKTYPDCKFSVRSEYYSMGSSIHVTLMEAPFEVSSTSEKHNFYPSDWAKKEFTTESYNILKEVYDYVESYNYDNSDPMTDYFDVNFHFSSIGIGQWDKPFKVVEPKKRPSKQQSSSEQVVNGIKLIDYSDKAVAIIGDTKPFKDLLKSLGGKFNPKLTCGAGWVFSKSQVDKISFLFS